MVRIKIITMKRKMLMTSFPGRCTALFLFVLLGGSVLSQQIPSYSLQYRHGCALEHCSPLALAPPYSWSMPLQVFQTYFVIDSVLRNPGMASSYRELYPIMKDYMGTVTNTDSLFKYLYITTEYDPLEFVKYLNQARYLREGYRVPAHVAYSALEDGIKENDFSCDRRKAFLAMCSGIYVVEVTNVAHDSVRYSDGSTSYNAVTCIRCDVQNVVKGNALVHNSYLSGGEGEHWLNISYADHWFKNKSVRFAKDVIVYTNIIANRIDSTGNVVSSQNIPNQNVYGSLQPSIGDRYIAILNIYMENHIDSIGTSYMLFPFNSFQPEGGMFKIVNGNVNDESNFFGFGTSVPIDMFLESLNAYIHDNFYHINQ